MVAALFGQSTTAQETFPVNGVVNKQLVRTALEHARVHVSSTEVLEDATVVFYQGRIEAVGRPRRASSSTATPERHNGRCVPRRVRARLRRGAEPSDV